MKTKYKLLKDLPGAKAGEIIETNEQGYGIGEGCGWILSNYPDFFEKVEEPKTILDLKDRDNFYRIDSSDNIDECFYRNYLPINYNNCFITRREAQKELAFRILRNRADKFLPTCKEYYYSIDYNEGKNHYWCNNKINSYHYNSGLIFRSPEERNEILNQLVDGVSMRDLIFNID